MIGSYLKMVPGYPIEPVLVGYQTAEASVSTSLVITKPTGTKAGYLLIAFVFGDGVTGWTFPSGWTEIVDDAGIGVAWKVAGASEGASYNITCNSGDLGGVIVLLRGCDPVDPIVAVGSVGEIRNPTVASSIVAEDNNFLFTFVGSGDHDRSWTTPDGMQVAATDYTGDSCWGLFYKEVDAGATGDISAPGLGRGLNIAVGPVS